MDNIIETIGKASHLRAGITLILTLHDGEIAEDIWFDDRTGEEIVAEEARIIMACAGETLDELIEEAREAAA